jgi:hypothetical protein
VQVGGGGGGGLGLGDGVAAAEGVLVEHRSRAVVGADAGKGSNPGQDQRPARGGLKQVGTPGVAAVAVAGDEDHRRTAFAAARQVHVAAAADVDQAGEVAARRGERSGGWGGRLGYDRDRRAEQQGEQAEASE